MSWVEFDVIEMYLGMFSGGWAIDGRTQAWSSHDDPVSALLAWSAEIERQRARRWRKASVSLWLSGGLARPFLCGPVAGLANWDEADAMASAMAPQETGFDGPCHVRLEDWPGESAALVTAVDVALAQAIDEVARVSRITWRSVRPRWASLLDDALAQQAATSLLACAEEDALTILGGPPRAQPRLGTGFDLAATHSPAPTADRSLALWHRTMLSRDVGPEDTCFVRLETPIPELDRPADRTGTRPRWPQAVRLDEGVSP